MKRFILKTGLYLLMIVVGLEILVRVFHLYNAMPERFLDEREVERWVPGQTGLSVTGNRKQNVHRYRLNALGFNSVYPNYTASNDSLEIALVGDSFFQGFHQPFANSLGQKIEHRLNGTFKVLEYGYAGYDMADQLHLIHQYPEWFDPIDYVVIYLKCVDDLDRDTYEVSERMGLDTPVNRVLKQIKLLVYIKDMGLIDPVKEFASEAVSLVRGGSKNNGKPREPEQIAEKRISNFKALIEKYGFDKKKNILLLDASLCSDALIEFLEISGIKYLDFKPRFDASEAPTYLIYDQHWNDHGRSLLAEQIGDYIHNLELLRNSGGTVEKN